MFLSKKLYKVGSVTRRLKIAYAPLTVPIECPKLGFHQTLRNPYAVQTLAYATVLQFNRITLFFHTFHVISNPSTNPNSIIFAIGVVEQFIDSSPRSVCEDFTCKHGLKSIASEMGNLHYCTAASLAFGGVLEFLQLSLGDQHSMIVCPRRASRSQKVKSILCILS